VYVILFIFFYGETKFTFQTVLGTSSPSSAETANEKAKEDDKNTLRLSQTQSAAAAVCTFQGINHAIPMKSYGQHMPWVTQTEGSFKKFFGHTYQPFIILFTFPAVAYSALQYGSILAWFSILATTETTYFAGPPYNFTTVGIGLLNLPAFIGCLLGAFWGGVLSDCKSFPAISWNCLKQR
jgi:hypothetical protein